jgi:hypothetical protein
MRISSSDAIGITMNRFTIVTAADKTSEIATSHAKA